MPNEPESLTIGAFAEQAAITVETIRFYQRRGLLPTPKKPQGGIRRYNTQHVARARFIRSAQGLGFSLHEIASLLRLDDGLHCAQARTVAEAKLADVRGKISDLTRIETVLADLVTDCLGARGRIACPLIDAIHSR